MASNIGEVGEPIDRKIPPPEGIDADEMQLQIQLFEDHGLEPDPGSADRAAFDPKASIESERNYEEAEAIEAAFVELIQATTTEEIMAQQPAPREAADSSDEISVLPVPTPNPAMEREAEIPPAPEARPKYPIDSDGYTPAFKENQQAVLDNIEGPTETVQGAVDGLKMANSMVGDLDDLLEELQAESPVSEKAVAAALKVHQEEQAVKNRAHQQESTSKEETDDDSRKPLQPLEDLSIVAGVELQGDVFAENSDADSLDTLRSLKREANEDLGDGGGGEESSGIHSGGREIPVYVSGLGGEPEAKMGDLTVGPRKRDDSELDAYQTHETSGTEASDSDMENWEDTEPLRPDPNNYDLSTEEGKMRYDAAMEEYEHSYILWATSKPTDEGTDGDKSADEAVSAGQLAAPFIPGGSVISSSIGDGDPSTG